MDQRIPTHGGAPTALDALREKHEGDVFETPVGLARDSAETQHKDIAEEKQERQADQPAKTAAASPKEPQADQLKTSSLPRLRLGKLHITSRSKEQSAKPHPAGEMPSDLIAKGIGEGGVAMAPPETTATGLQGLVVIGALVGLARGAVTGIRKRHG
jgi:hypothetical protein